MYSFEILHEIFAWLSDELEIHSVQINDRVPTVRKGIAWPSDKHFKFKNPTIPDGKLLKDGIILIYV